MAKAVLKILPLFVLVALIAGCGTTKKVDVRAYVDDRQRVDQEFSGAVGNWEGAPQAVDPGNRKETRKIYVLEVSKEAEDLDNKIFKLQPTDEPEKEAQYVTDPSIEENQREMTKQPDGDLPPVVSRETPPPPVVVPAASGTTVEYTVEKDDTLQKISKKFYDSYSKWTRIYEANKDKIKNPDFLQPGITLDIPMD